MAPPLTHTLGTLDIPRSLVWVDEYAWSATVRTHEYSLTGALIVDVATRQAGRPITLSGTDDHGWVSRGSVDALWQMVNTATGPMQLSLADGRTFSVLFASDDNPIEAKPITRAELPPADLPYIVTLRLMTA